MSKTVISVENLSKSYRLGQIGTGTLTNDLKVWAAKIRGKPNPMLKIGQTDHGNLDGETLWALNDITFQVEQGEVLGVIGRNGAGKSTLLKILSRVTAPTNGCVKVKGRIASLLEVGTGFHPDLTGRENIYLNGAILGMSKEEVKRKFDEIVAFAETEQFIDTPVKRYSSGMYVRLAFAVAAHLEAEILLVDEVLAVGDAEFQKKCLGKMGDVATQEGRTVLFVSHNMAAVERLCPKCEYLKNGKIEFLGDTNKGIELYIGEAPLMNDKKIVNDYRLKSSNLSLINDIKFFSIENIQKNKFKIEEDIIIELELSNILSIDQKPIVGIGVSNWRDVRIFTLMSYNGRNESDWIKCNIIRCRIPNNNLMPGNYSLKISVNLKGEQKDVIQNYPSFEVIQNDFFKSGKLPNNSQGVVIRDSIWEYLHAK